MIGRIAKFLLVATSLAPIALTWAFADWRASGPAKRQLQVLVVTGLLVLICWLVVLASRKQIAPVSFSVSSLRPADSEVVGFVVAYLLPLATTSTNQIDYAVLGFVGLLLALVVSATNAYSFNPLLTLFGFHFYEVTENNGVTFLLLTQRDVRRARDIAKVVQLTNYLVLDPGDPEV